MSPATARLFGPIFVVLGVLMIVRAIQAGGGALALGVVLGGLFVALGVLRLYGARRGGGGDA